MTIPLNHWLAAHYLPEQSSPIILELLKLFPDITTLFQSDLSPYGLKPAFIAAMKSPDWQLIESDIKWGTQPDCHLICYDDPRYPPLLKQITDPPLVLFLRGNPDVLKEPQLAMVGARRATVQGSKAASQFAAALSLSGLVITSGLAKGIDAESHRGVVSVQGKTIAVMGTGIDTVYPKQNQKLAEDILKYQGALISEFPRAAAAMPHHFPKRNRIVAGMSMGVLVVEAEIQSGSLISARLAMEAGREVFAIPGPISHPLSKGCHHLIRQGAKLVESPADILEELRAYQSIFTPEATCVTKRETMATLSPKAQIVLKEIQFELTALDTIIFNSGLTAGEVSSMLLPLELDGYIESVVGGYKRITQ